jgi:hypothetical protein
VVSILDVSFGVLMHGWERKVRVQGAKGPPGSRNPK